MRRHAVKKKDKEIPASKEFEPDLDAIISEVSHYYKVKPTNLKTVCSILKPISSKIKRRFDPKFSVFALFMCGNNFVDSVLNKLL